MDEFNYNEFNLVDDQNYQHINIPYTSANKPILSNHAHSVNGPAMHMTIKAQLKHLKEKYDTLEQKAKTLQLENREYSSEINKLNKENEELQTKNKLLSQQHTEIYDNKKSMANILSSKSMVLDKQQIRIETLQYEIIKQQQSIKTLTTQNNNLITENKNYKNVLEETVIKNNLYLKEKQQYIKQIELLTHNIQELQHQIHMFTISPIPDEEFKSMEQSRSNSQSTDVLGKAKTVKFELSYTSRHSSYDDAYDEHSHNNIMSNTNKKYTGRRYSAKSIMSVGSGTSYMGINELRDKSHNNIFSDQLKPLMDSPHTSVVSEDIKNINIHLTQSHTDEVGINYNSNNSIQSMPLGYDAASMHFDGKLIELLNEQQNHINDLNDKYNDLNDKYEILQNDYKEQKLKLSKRGNTIKELRAKNDDLSKKLASSKSCIAFDWFN